MVVSPMCELCIGDVKNKQLRKFNYLSSKATNNGKYERNLKAYIGIAKTAFEKLNKILEDRMAVDAGQYRDR